MAKNKVKTFSILRPGTAKIKINYVDGPSLIRTLDVITFELRKKISLHER